MGKRTGSSSSKAAEPMTDYREDFVDARDTKSNSNHDPTTPSPQQNVTEVNSQLTEGSVRAWLRGDPGAFGALRHTNVPFRILIAFFINAHANVERKDI